MYTYVKGDSDQDTDVRGGSDGDSAVRGYLMVTLT